LDKIVFPLDGGLEESLAWAAELGDLVGCLKIGLELFVAAGPGAVAAVKKKAPKAKIFLDLKLHDIPATMAKAAAAAASLGVDLLTVHAQAGPEALAAAAAAAKPAQTLAVTVLTSLRPEAFPELAPPFQEPGRWALALAERALVAGCQGLVASPQEVKAIRLKLGPGPLLAVPGVRPAWAKVQSDDQKRVGSPAQAVRDGADLIVVGRPIREAPDRRAAALAVARETAA
jgi:orotidine-5'-phosphate decarboxylase